MVTSEKMLKDPQQPGTKRMKLATIIDSNPDSNVLRTPPPSAAKRKINVDDTRNFHVPSSSSSSSNPSSSSSSPNERQDYAMDNLITTVKEIRQLSANLCQKFNVDMDRPNDGNATDDSEGDMITIEEISRLLPLTNKISREEIYRRIDRLVEKSEVLRQRREAKRRRKRYMASRTTTTDTTRDQKKSKDGIEQLIYCLQDEHHDKSRELPKTETRKQKETEDFP